MQMSLQAESMLRAVKKKIEKDTALFPEENAPTIEDTEMTGSRRYIPDEEDFRKAASMQSFSSKLAKSKSVSTSKSSSTDFGLRMGRSFRVGWSPDGSFFSLGNLSSLPADLAASSSASAILSSAPRMPPVSCSRAIQSSAICDRMSSSRGRFE